MRLMRARSEVLAVNARPPLLLLLLSLTLMPDRGSVYPVRGAGGPTDRAPRPPSSRAGGGTATARTDSGAAVAFKTGAAGAAFSRPSSTRRADSTPPVARSTCPTPLGGDGPTQASSSSSEETSAARARRSESSDAAGSGGAGGCTPATRVTPPLPRAGATADGQQAMPHVCVCVCVCGPCRACVRAYFE
jgi:hypothetical protein